MNRPHRFFAALLLGVALATPPHPALAESDGLETAAAGFRGAVDIVVLRPVSFTRLVIGSAVLLPISSVLNLAWLPVGRDFTVFREDLDRFVLEPVDYTFAREVGEDLEGSF